MKKGDKMFGRSVRYVVTPVEVVRAGCVRTDDQVHEAQAMVDDDMISALEDMINAAKANKLTDRDAVLAVGAAAW